MVLLVISVGLGLLMAAALYRLFFKDFGDFIECVRFYFQPDLISILRNEWREDMWGTMKLGVWAAISIIMGLTAHYKLPQLIPQLAEAKPAQWESWSTPSKPKAYAAKELPAAARAPSKPATNSPTQPAALPEPAIRYGVKPGDTVEISALTPAIALRRAVITAMDNEQLTVKSSADSYTILWKDLTRLKVASKK